MDFHDTMLRPVLRREAPVDLELESSSGGSRRLASLRGSVVVIFWEDRERHRANPELKRALGAMTHPGLRVLAVGDVQAYDFAPARRIVRGAITTIARAIGVEILFDWKGALAAPPFSLAPGEPNVLVLDVEGRPVMRARGELDRGAQERVLDIVRAQLRDVAPIAA